MAGAQTFVWDANGSDAFDLQKPNAPANSRLAATWFLGAPYSIHVGVSGAAARRVAIYALNWNGGSQSERIDVVDDATGAVVDTCTVANYANGVYLSWHVKGNVTFRITPLGGSLALTGALFFG